MNRLRRAGALLCWGVYGLAAGVAMLSGLVALVAAIYAENLAEAALEWEAEKGPLVRGKIL